MGIFINNQNRRRDYDQIAQLQNQINSYLANPNVDESAKSSARKQLEELSASVNTYGSRKEARKSAIQTLNSIASSLKPEDNYTPQYITPTIGIKASATFDPQIGEQKYNVAGLTPNLKQRVDEFSQFLIDQLTFANRELAAGKLLYNWKDSNTSKINEWISKLQAPVTTEEDLKKRIDFMGNTIVNALASDSLANAFASRFAPWLEGSDEYAAAQAAAAEAKRENTITINGKEAVISPYTNDVAQKLMTDAGWKVYKQGEEYYVAGDNANKQLVILDPTHDYYKYGVVTDGNGKIFFGDLSSDAFHQMIASRSEAVKAAIKEMHKSHYTVQDNREQGGRYGIDLSNYMRDNNVYFLDLEEDNFPLFLDYDKIFGKNWDKSKFVWEGNADATAADVDLNNQYLDSIGGNVELSDNAPEFTEQVARNRFSGNTGHTGDINSKGGGRDVTVTELLNIQDGNYADKILQFVADYLEAWKSQDQNVKDAFFLKYPKALEKRVHKTEGENTLDDLFMWQLENEPELFISILKAIISDPKYADKRKYAVEAYKNLIPKGLKGLKVQEKSIMDESAVARKAREMSGPVTLDRMTDREKAVMWVDLATALSDIVGAFTGPWGGVGSSINNMGLRIARNSITEDKGFENKVAPYLIEGLTGISSALPLIGNKTKLLKAKPIISGLTTAFGLTAAGLSTYLAATGIEGTAEALDKVFTGRYRQLTQDDIAALQKVIGGITTGIVTSKNIRHTSKHNVGKNSDAEQWVKTKNPDGKTEAVKVKNSELKAAKETKGYEGLPRNVRQQLAQEMDGVPKGNTVPVDLLGRPYTRPVRSVDEQALANLHAWQLRKGKLNRGTPTASADYNTSENFKFNLGIDFGNWNWSSVKPKSTKIIGNTPVLEVASQDMNRAQKQIFKGKNIQKVSQLSDDLKTVIPEGSEVWTDGKTYIWTAAKKRDGGRLNRLNNYLNKK